MQCVSFGDSTCLLCDNYKQVIWFQCILLCFCFPIRWLRLCLYLYLYICDDLKRWADLTQNELIVWLRRHIHTVCVIVRRSVVITVFPTRFKNLAHNYWRSLNMHIDYVALLLIRVFQRFLAPANGAKAFELYEKMHLKHCYTVCQCNAVRRFERTQFFFQ